MTMGTRRQRQRQEELWFRRDLAEAPGHPFYRRLNEVLEQAKFDEFCETRCRKFYHEKLGRPSLAAQPSSNPGEFKTPWTLAGDSAGNVYVVDYGNKRVQKFNVLGQVVPGFCDNVQASGVLKEPIDIA